MTDTLHWTLHAVYYLLGGVTGAAVVLSVLDARLRKPACDRLGHQPRPVAARLLENCVPAATVVLLRCLRCGGLRSWITPGAWDLPDFCRPESEIEELRRMYQK